MLVVPRELLPQTAHVLAELLRVDAFLGGGPEVVRQTAEGDRKTTPVPEFVAHIQMLVVPLRQEIPYQRLRVQQRLICGRWKQQAVNEPFNQRSVTRNIVNRIFNLKNTRKDVIECYIYLYRGVEVAGVAQVLEPHFPLVHAAALPLRQGQGSVRSRGSSGSEKGRRRL